MSVVKSAYKQHVVEVLQQDWNKFYSGCIDLQYATTLKYWNFKKNIVKMASDIVILWKRPKYCDTLPNIVSWEVCKVAVQSEP